MARQRGRAEADGLREFAGPARSTSLGRHATGNDRYLRI
jgi:hypothetical protein